MGTKIGIYLKAKSRGRSMRPVLISVDRLARVQQAKEVQSLLMTTVCRTNH
jgi:hypothetical protein